MLPAYLLDVVTSSNYICPGVWLKDTSGRNTCQNYASASKTRCETPKSSTRAAKAARNSLVAPTETEELGSGTAPQEDSKIFR